tara:strand:- start:3917 stop:4300 length:384 start_codon:yes stop_codon:yes gene_type:complete
MTDPLENYDDLSEHQQSLLEYELLNRAFLNSFEILTKRKTMRDIVKESGGLLLSHDPYKDLTPKDLVNMMDYFIEIEDYEKCAEVRDLVKKIKAKNARKQKKDPAKELSAIFNKSVRGTKTSKNKDS